VYDVEVLVRVGVDDKDALVEPHAVDVPRIAALGAVRRKRLWDLDLLVDNLDELDVLGAPVKGHLKGERLARLVVRDVGDLVIVRLYRRGHLGLGGPYREGDHVGDADKRVIV